MVLVMGEAEEEAGRSWGDGAPHGFAGLKGFLATLNHRRARLGFWQDNNNAHSCASMVIFWVVSLAFNG